jgi:hypothetical protein
MGQMTVEDVQKLCPKAERITITPDGTIGLKVGEFSQAVGTAYNKDRSGAERLIRNLYNDLLAMNREQDSQIRAAQNASRG